MDYFLITARLGEQVRQRRLNRGFTQAKLAALAGVTRQKVIAIERGDPSVLMVTYLRVLATLQLEDDLSLIAKEDRLGRSLQDLDLPHGRSSHAR